MFTLGLNMVCYLISSVYGFVSFFYKLSIFSSNTFIYPNISLHSDGDTNFYSTTFYYGYE